jgi:alpha/beta superfamily hydrolase
MRVRRARTSCETSLMILAFSFGDRVVNHLARRYERASVYKFGVTEGRGAYDFTLP